MTAVPAAPRAARGHAALPGREYLLPGEVASTLGVSAKTVSRWARERRLAHITTIGGHRRFHRVQVQALLQELRRSQG